MSLPSVAPGSHRGKDFHFLRINAGCQNTPSGQGPQQPYGQQPYGAPQTGYPAAPGGVKPNNYLAWSIASIILFWPLEIAAITNATKVDPAWQMGNAAIAQEHSNKAKMFSMIATIIGAAGFVISFIIGWRLGRASTLSLACSTAGLATDRWSRTSSPGRDVATAAARTRTSSARGASASPPRLWRLTSRAT
jgi:hypothetical protein